ncbi:MAG: hypothetical protein BUE48_006790 [Thermomonospora sp. CIF 1]|nr:MAG: hypothetical protein BUE48_006790 [Thermomonospora sp. CIF 1]
MVRCVPARHLGELPAHPRRTADRRAVDAPVPRERGRGAQLRLRGLGAGSDAGGRADRLFDRAHRRAEGQVLHHGRQHLAGGRIVAAARGRVRPLLPAPRRAAVAAGAGDRRRAVPVRARPGRPGAHLRRAAAAARPVNVGPRDQRAVEERADVVRFTTPVLERDVEVTGPITVVLHAATSASGGGDWTAKLVDVHPDGRAMSVIDGIVRSGGGKLRHEIDLAATSQVFRAGHRIRLEVASSDFPCFDRNPATKRAEQTVFCDAERPSWITLPVMGG